MSILSPHIAPRARLDAAVDQGPLHLRDLYRAVRDYGISFATVTQHAGRFAFPSDKPVVALLGDDMHQALGPTAFHRKSVRRFVASCKAAVIVACEAQPRFYMAAAVTAAVLRQNVVVVETRSEHEADWFDLLREINPSINMLVGAVRPETEARH